MASTEQSSTDRVRSIWDRQAGRYDRDMDLCERILFTGDREWAGSFATGDVLEVAVGTGRNLPYYPAGVRLTGVDLSPEMLRRARARADDLRPGAALGQADAQRLPFADHSFDSVVCTLSLCSIPDDRQAVAEMVRVLRPGGRLILVEHVASPNPLVRGGQWLAHQITYRLACDHLLRRPREVVLGAGLVPVAMERRKAGIVDRIVARKP